MTADTGPWWRRANAWMDRTFTPRTITDWRRFGANALLAMTFAAIGSMTASLWGGDGAIAGLVFSPFNLILLIAYSVTAGQWWQLCFRTIRDRSADDATARRWLVRGGLVWLAVVYVVILVSQWLYAVAGDDPEGWEVGIGALIFTYLIMPAILFGAPIVIGRLGTNRRR